MEIIHDMHVVDTEPLSHQNQSPEKVSLDGRKG